MNKIKPTLANTFFKLSSAVVIILISSISLFSGSKISAAASASMSLSPGSANLNKSNYLTIGIYENSGTEPVNAAQANLTYDAGKFKYISITSSTAFNIAAQSTGGGGSVKIGRGAMTAVTGKQLVASVKFQSLVGSGSTAITIDSSSQVVSSNTNTNILSSRAGGSYTFSTPTQPPSPPATSPPPSPSSKTTNPVKLGVSPATSTVTKALKISSLSAQVTGYTSVTITWTTSAKANSEVSFGDTSKYGYTAVDGANVTKHSMDINSPLLSSATKIHYKVKSTDENGNSASSSDKTFSTQGVTLSIKVTDEKGNPVSGAVVTLADPQQVTTGSDGIAKFSGVPTGSQSFSVSYQGVTKSFTTDVKGADASGQVFATFKIPAGGSGSNSKLILAVVILVVAAVLALLMRMFKRRPPEHGASAPPINPTVPPPSTPINNMPPQTPGGVISPNVQPPSTVITPNPAPPPEAPVQQIPVTESKAPPPNMPNQAPPA